MIQDRRRAVPRAAERTKLVPGLVWAPPDCILRAMAAGPSSSLLDLTEASPRRLPLSAVGTGRRSAQQDRVRPLRLQDGERQIQAEIQGSRPRHIT